MGGLKHMDVAPGRADQACGEVRRLAPNELDRVLDFIYTVIAERQPVAEEPGTPEKLLQHQSRWSFNEGERARLLQNLREMRGADQR